MIEVVVERRGIGLWLRRQNWRRSDDGDRVKSRIGLRETGVKFERLELVQLLLVWLVKAGIRHV